MGEAAVIWGRLTESFWLNCQLFGLTLLFAIPLGLVVAFGSMSRFAPLRGVVKTFVWAIRGTPLMLQILVIYLGPGLMGFTNPWPSGSSGRLVAAVVAFAINYACYFSEIYRGGIEAVLGCLYRPCFCGESGGAMYRRPAGAGPPDGYYRGCADLRVQAARTAPCGAGIFLFFRRVI